MGNFIKDYKIEVLASITRKYYLVSSMRPKWGFTLFLPKSASAHSANDNFGKRVLIITVYVTSDCVCLMRPFICLHFNYHFYETLSTIRMS
jgi:hypothetical protein